MITGDVSEIGVSVATGGHAISAADSLLTLSNGELEIAVDVPGAHGTYCGPRFSWAGIISHVKCGKHRLFGPWRTGKYSTDVHDNVTGTAGEFGMGTAGMPAPLGFNESAAGGHFVKIGIGVLRKPDDEPYSFGRRYEIVDAPRWQVVKTGQWVNMRQVLEHDGYGYDYCHRIETVPGCKSFITRHALTNTGRKPIHQTHYSHNFLIIDQEPIGPAYELMFHFTPDDLPLTQSLAYVKGNSLNFRELIPAGKALFTQLSGFGDTAVDNWVMIRNRDIGVDLCITGDRPVVRYHLFAVCGSVCPEPFVELLLHPGETVTWQHRYDLSCSS